MGNIVDFVRLLLTDADEQHAFGEGDAAYVAAHGLADSSGEDVVEAVRAVLPKLPPEIAERLHLYNEGDDRLPPVRPLIRETTFDAALRQLQFAVSLAPLERRVPDMTPPEPRVEIAEAVNEPTIEWSPEPSWAAEAEPEAQPEPEPAPDEPTPEERRAEPQPAMAVAEPLAPEPGGPTLAGDPFDAFAGELADAARAARARLEQTLERGEAEAATVREKAAREANDMLEAARAEREEAHAWAERTRKDADEILLAAQTREQAARVVLQELNERLAAIANLVETLPKD
jgi:cell division septum initiation protein DivIVA